MQSLGGKHMMPGGIKRKKQDLKSHSLDHGGDQD
jgi:hypothetical protein